jgi:hypothetical protein
MLKTISLSIILISFFVACTVRPKPVFRLIPYSEKSAWLHGQEFIHLDNDSFDIALAYDRMWVDNYVFDIEIANKTNRTVLISPEDFYYILMEQRPTFNYFIDSLNALDPEQKILQMDLNQSVADANYETKDNQLAGLFFLDLVFDIATIGQTKTDVEEAQEEIDDLERELEDAENELEHQNTIRNISRIKDQWRDEALRKTSLKSNYSINGKIYFPIKYAENKYNPFSKKLLFCFPLGDTLFTQIFDRKKYIVK